MLVIRMKPFDAKTTGLLLVLIPSLPWHTFKKGIDKVQASGPYLRYGMAKVRAGGPYLR